ncbi:MAG: VWA domain-containing protein [Paludibacteraceae bacterium]|nr:VWA domain-containing protein [Paludibacteraceae bacterium]
MTFAHPYYLLLLLLIIPIVAYYILRQRTLTAEIRFSSLLPFENAKKSYKHYLRHLPFVLHMLALTALIVALARPQKSDSWSNKTTEGIDIVMSLDISSSMLAEDLRPNRLDAAKQVATQFISQRPNDNIGMVVFAGESFTQCPLTINHSELINLLKGVRCGMIEDGTAIGSGLATAVNRIKDSKAKSKVIILLTDGSNNRGQVAPVTAGEIAKTFGIRVYTIGVGTRGKAPYPFQTPYGIKYQDVDVDIDESTLQQIADITGGAYFRATDNAALQEIYQEIDQLEKSKIQVNEFSKKDELYHWFVMAMLVCLLGEMLLRQTVFKSIP